MWSLECIFHLPVQNFLIFRFPIILFPTPFSYAQARISKILKISMTNIIGVDKKCRVNQWNLEAEKVYGLIREDVLEKELTDVVLT